MPLKNLVWVKLRDYVISRANYRLHPAVADQSASFCTDFGKTTVFCGGEERAGKNWSNSNCRPALDVLSSGWCLHSFALQWLPCEAVSTGPASSTVEKIKIKMVEFLSHHSVLPIHRAECTLKPFLSLYLSHHDRVDTHTGRNTQEAYG